MKKRGQEENTLLFFLKNRLIYISKKSDVSPGARRLQRDMEKAQLSAKTRLALLAALAVLCLAVYFGPPNSADKIKTVSMKIRSAITEVFE